MDVGDESVHGGLLEAALHLGNFKGTAESWRNLISYFLEIIEFLYSTKLIEDSVLILALSSLHNARMVHPYGHYYDTIFLSFSRYH